MDEVHTDMAPRKKLLAQPEAQVPSMTSLVSVLYLMLLAIKNIATYPSEGSALMLTDRLRAEYGPYVHSCEASAMSFISQNTSIPVPRVVCTFTHNGST